MNARLLITVSAVLATIASLTFFPSAAEGSPDHQSPELVDRLIAMNEMAVELYAKLRYQVDTYDTDSDGESLTHRTSAEVFHDGRRLRVRETLLPTDERRQRMEVVFVRNDEYVGYWLDGGENVQQFMHSPDGKSHRLAVPMAQARANRNMVRRLFGGIGSMTLSDYRQQTDEMGDWTAERISESPEIYHLVFTTHSGRPLRNTFTIDASRNYIVTAMETSINGVVAARSTATLQELAPGLWFPTVLRERFFGPDGKVTSGRDYQTKGATLVSDFPRDFFAIEGLGLTEDNYVLRSEPDGTGSILRLLDGVLVPNRVAQDTLNRRTADTASSQPVGIVGATGVPSRTRAGFLRSAGITLSIAGGVVLALAAFAYWWRRRTGMTDQVA